MRPGKREWVYAGLSVPPGVGLVRSNTDLPVTCGAVVLFAGGPAARPLVRPLGALVRGARSTLWARVMPEGDATSWRVYGWLENSLGEVQPSVVLLALEPADQASAVVLRDLVLPRARLLWMPPSGAPAHPGPWGISGPRRHTLSAQDYASWAGAAWSALRP